MSDRLADMLHEFHEAFDIKPDRELRLKLIREEKAELIEAVQNVLKEFCDFAYVLQAAVNEGITPDEIVAEVGDAPAIVSDLVWEFPDDVRLEALERVHASNMSKLVDGKPIRREDGKVLKGPNYKAPDLSDLLK